MFVFVHIPPIFSVLLSCLLKINSLVFLTHYVCVGVRQTAGGACEVTGGTENIEPKMVYFNLVTIKLFK